ncbi:MAG: co-chaperone DjlA [Proteobacteria bacterium]|nr:co-chaperone DjlA [Pseudomonadota bacterium]MCH8177618.1 co-chaperone DjlA [Pseudomonadota bacterium]
MAWWGKALGGAFGFMIGGPLGALMGIAFGHNFDRGLKGLGDSSWQGADQGRVQAAFFTAAFSVMGYIAKADGKVTRDEIKLAQTVMSHLGLSAEMRESAKKLFNEGKSSDFPIDEVLDQFKKESRRRTTLIQMFLEIQLQAAYADGVMHPSERRVLNHICQRLGFPPAHLDRMEEMLKAGFGGGYGPAKPAQASVEDAYAMLGADPSINNVELKKAYRRLMSQYHPDKLVAKGLPDEMIRDATEKTQQIKSAYETLRESRGI